MFHLTRYKYVFFGISLAIIIPGLLALIFWGLNLGIDFTGGSTVNVVFASNTVTANQIQAVMVKDKAQDVNVLATKPLDIKNTPTPDRYAFITFDHPIGKNVETEVLKRLRTLDSSAQITKTIYTVAYPADTKTPTAQMVVLFDKAMKQGDITKALQNLPKSDPAPVETASNATPTPNATPKATGSATAGATATSAATATPKATASATATATATPAPSAQQHEVAVTKVTPGANNQTYQINTQTTLDTNAVNTLTAQLIHEFGPAYSPSHESVGGSVSSDTTRDAILAVLFASAAIMIYISIAFRKVGSLRQSFRFGASAIIALLHDALVILGL
ncbi:MAG TPA: hypothetical protein VJR48_02695, partial [Ktedonobacterales bacterium]|nr:hypothetical protein [Ktedonobacterales bacterium]